MEEYNKENNVKIEEETGDEFEASALQTEEDSTGKGKRKRSSCCFMYNESDIFI
jgi:hypothetical protein